MRVYYQLNGLFKLGVVSSDFNTNTLLPRNVIIPTPSVVKCCVFPYSLMLHCSLHCHSVSFPSSFVSCLGSLGTSYQLQASSHQLVLTFRWQ